MVVTLAGVTPLLPGLAAYRGFYQLAIEGPSEGLVTITIALAVGLALAAGVALGQFVASPRRRPEDRPGGAESSPTGAAAVGAPVPDTTADGADPK